MIEILGALVTLAVLVAVLRTAMGSPRRARSIGSRPLRWFAVLGWVPVGFALAKLLGAGVPLPLLVVVGLGVAAAHRAAGGLVELGLGAGALTVGIIEATSGSLCRAPLGPVGLLLVLGLGSIGVLFAGTGSLAGRRGGFGRLLVVGVAALELVVFVLSPVGGVVTNYQPGPLPVLAVIAALLLSFGLGVLGHLALAAIGACLVAAEVTLAVAGGACASEGLSMLATALGFAVVRALIESRPVALERRRALRIG